MAETRAAASVFFFTAEARETLRECKKKRKQAETRLPMVLRPCLRAGY
jgi:hypothetical protein